MYKRKFAAALLVLFFSGLLGVQADPAKSSVSLDGQAPKKIGAIFPGGTTYLDLNALATAYRWRVVKQSGAILLNRKKITDIKEYERKIYVNAQSVADNLGLTLKSTKNGLVLDLFTKSAGASQSNGAAPQLKLRVLKNEKGTTSNPKFQTLKLTVEIKNSSSRILRLNANQFKLIDSKGSSADCDGSFDIVVQGKKTQKVEGLYFSIPRQNVPKELKLFSSDRKALGSARI